MKPINTGLIGSVMSTKLVPDVRPIMAYSLLFVVSVHPHISLASLMINIIHIYSNSQEKT